MEKSTLFFVILVWLQAFTYGNPSGRVIGGSNANLGDFPYMISLQRTNHLCGGSILTSRSILTAGHCLGLDPATYSVYVGSNTLNSGGVRYQVEDYVIHPEFYIDDDTANNDVGIVYLTTDIEFSSLITPIELDTEYIDGGLNVTFSGWGYTSYPWGWIPNTLQYINFNTLNQSECIDSFSGMYPVDPDQICTFTTAGEGMCLGDSGSPLVRNGKQIGVASWVEPCAVGYPDVFARISVLAEWIQSVTI